MKHCILSIVLIACSSLAASETNEQSVVIIPSLKDKCIDLVAAHTAQKDSDTKAAILNSFPPELALAIKSCICRRTINVQQFFTKYVWLSKKGDEFPTEFPLNQLTPAQLISAERISVCEQRACLNFEELSNDFRDKLTHEWFQHVIDKEDEDPLEHEMSLALITFLRLNKNGFFLKNVFSEEKSYVSFHLTSENFRTILKNYPILSSRSLINDAGSSSPKLLRSFL